LSNDKKELDKLAKEIAKIMTKAKDTTYRIKDKTV
jgi:hypothetical protein